ncbi:MAG: hypothetical protein M5U01_33370 [Ardenticatenaceae bacterium]|nr:hypothetical protein [Ardenticatenaceae bacterium]
MQAHSDNRLGRVPKEKLREIAGRGLEAEREQQEQLERQKLKQIEC